MMRSDGPYRKMTHYTKFESREPRIDVYGEGVDELDVSDAEGRGVLRLANIAYAEGRKASEKEFKELLDLANSMEFLAGCRSSASVKFDAWKKARGIE